MSKTIFLPFNGSQQNVFSPSGVQLHNSIVHQMSQSPLNAIENAKPFVLENIEHIHVIFNHQHYKKMFEASIQLMKKNLGLEEPPSLKDQLQGTLNIEAKNRSPSPPKKPHLRLNF